VLAGHKMRVAVGRLLCSESELDALKGRVGESVALEYYVSIDLPPTLAIQRFLACT